MRVTTTAPAIMGVTTTAGDLVDRLVVHDWATLDLVIDARATTLISASYLTDLITGLLITRGIHALTIHAPNRAAQEMCATTATDLGVSEKLTVTAPVAAA